MDKFENKFSNLADAGRNASHSANYGILKKIRPIIHDMLEKNMEEALELDKTERVEVEASRDGNGVIFVIKRAENGEEKAFRLNSSYSPVKEAERWGKQYEINDIDAVYFMFGLGNGYFVREIMKKMRKDTLLIVYEPSVKVFRAAMDNFDLSDILENERIIPVIRGINDEYLPQAMDRTIFWANMNTLKKCIHPQYDEAYKDEMDEYDRIVWDGYTKARSNVNTAAKFQTVFAPNTLYSMSLMKHNNILFDLYNVIDRDVPVILVSAGPSLEKNIDGLKDAKGKAYIMAVDKTIPILLKHDIIPDFLITIDAKKIPYYFSDPRCYDIPLFCLFESNSSILARHTGRKIFFDSSEYPKAILMMAGKETTAFNSGGSVATSAYTVCLALEMKNIIFIGQDLAYLDGKTHAGNISSGELSNGGVANHREVEGIDGNMVTTRADWYRYLDWFNQAIESNPQCHVVDATEGGAKIKGTEILTLKEAIDTYCTKEIDCKKMIEEMPPALNKNQYLAMVDYVRSSANELVLIKGRLQRSVNDCDRLIRACRSRTVNEPKYNKPIKELSQTNKYVEGRPVYKLLDSLVVTDAVAALNDIYVQSDDPDENLRRTFEQSRDFYNALLDAAKKLEPLLEDTIKNMENEERGYDDVEVKNLNTLIIVFGLGDGKYLRELLKKCREDTKIIVYEPLAKAYRYHIENSMTLDILNDKRVLVAMGSRQIEEYVKAENDMKYRPITFFEALDREYAVSGDKIVLCHPRYDIGYKKAYQQFKDGIEDVKKRIAAQKNTKEAYGKKIIKNQLLSLKMAGQAVSMENIKKGLCLKKPVLIVSTGPSLAKSIDLIKKIRDKVYIFAVDSSMNFLINRDVLPDFSITVDPNKWKEHFKKDEAKKIPLFCRMDSNLNILKEHTGPLFYFGSTPYASAVLEKFGKTQDWVEDTGGSVSTAALSVCFMLGFERIILIGQDLCYKTGEGDSITATHAHGKVSPDEKKQGYERKYIPGNTDEKVLTRQDWYRYLKWTENEAAKHPNVLVENATSGGAKIPGIPWISEEELENSLLSVSREELKKDSMSTSVERNSEDTDNNKVLQVSNIQENLTETGLSMSGLTPLFEGKELEEFSDYIKGLPAQRQELLNKVRKMISTAGKLKNAAKNRIIGQKSFKQPMKEVSSLNQWVQEQPLYLLADLLVPEDDSRELYTISEDEMENLAITYKQVEALYRRIEKALVELEPLMNEIL